jgi:hypothetical protein
LCNVHESFEGSEEAKSVLILAELKNKNKSPKRTAPKRVEPLISQGSTASAAVAGQSLDG